MKKLLLIGIMFSSLSYADVYNYKVTRVIDGDTVVIEAPYLPKPLKPSLSLRINGVDTPEKAPRAKCTDEATKATAASAYTRQLVRNGKEIKVDIAKWDKYGGRVLGDLIIDGNTLSSQLINNGYAREYHGGAKKSWCNK